MNSPVTKNKICTKCNKTLSLDYFHKAKLGTLGLRAICKSCHREALKVWRANNRIKTKAQSKRNYYKHKDELKYKEYNKNFKKLHYIENKDTYIKRAKLFYVKNRETIKKRAKQWKANNPERYKVLNASQCLKRRGYGKPDKKIIQQVFTEQDSCSYCNSKNKLTLEHIWPLVRGGTNDYTNLVLACFSCNVSKQDIPLATWLWVKANEQHKL